LLEESESSGKEVFGFQTPSKSAGSMAQKAEEERRRGTPQRQPRTPLSKRKTMTPRTPLAQQFTTPNKVGFLSCITVLYLSLLGRLYGASVFRADPIQLEIYKTSLRIRITLMRIRTRFCYLMRIRIQLFTMRIRIKVRIQLLLKVMRICDH
jgi:hypothetical protein